jgi:acyl-CoA reductase-like NAD-dependent aldehyde dehydrogenase
VTAARKASKPWAKVPWDERAKLLHKLADAIEANSDIFKKWLIMESGKPAQVSQSTPFNYSSNLLQSYG